MYSKEKLQAYVERSLSSIEQTLVEEHFAGCTSCHAELEELQELDGWVKERYSVLHPTEIPSFGPEELFAQFELTEEELESKDSVPSPNLWSRFSSEYANILRWFGTLEFVVVAAAFALVFFSAKDMSLVNKTQKAPEFLAKGWKANMLYGHRVGPHKYERAKTANGRTILYPLDTIQFSYFFSAGCFVAVVGLNEEGEVFPLVLSEQKTGRLRPAGQGTFPANKSFVLDRYIGDERYFFVSSNQMFTWGMLKQKIKSSWKKHNGDLSSFTKLPGPWQVRTWWVTKRTRSK